MKVNNKEKLIWNEAVKCVANELKLYDGLIEEEETRKYLSNRLIEKFSYKTVKKGKAK